MKAWKRGGVIVLGLVVLALGIAFMASRPEDGQKPSSPSTAAPSTPASASGAGAAPSPRPSSSAPPGKAGGTAPAAASKPREVIADVPWGRGPSQLGRERPQEGNPEAPMSLAVTPLGDVMVLDQLNGRIMRFGPDGQVLGNMPLTQQTPQDVIVAKDGSVLTLDRLRDKSVAILDPNTGTLKGELPLGGPGVPEPGLITGTFVDGDSVYVEREHGALVRVGDLSGTPDPTQPQLPGRPTRDGRSYVLATIADARSGRVVINDMDRESGQQRFARDYRLQMPLLYITLLDSDRSGVIYLGVRGEQPTGMASPATAPMIRLLCLAPLDGTVLGQAELPASDMPEETFRDFTVLDDGGVIYQYRTEAGVSLRRADCRS